MTSLSSPLEWLPQVSQQLQKIDNIPLTNTASTFPWKQLSERIAKIFECDGLDIRPNDIRWRTKEQFYEGIGDLYFPLIFSVSSLQGSVCWVISEQENAVLSALLLTKQADPLHFQDTTINDSFRNFISLEIMYQFTELSADHTLIPLISRSINFTCDTALCLDITLTYSGHTVWSRLMVSPEFQRSWSTHFDNLSLHSPLTQKITQVVDITIHIEIGQVQLSFKEWSNINLGDIVLLDQCLLDSNNFAGIALLTIDGRQRFRASLHDSKLKIVEVLLLNEVNTIMTKDNHKQSNYDDEDSFSGLDFSEDEDSNLDLFSDHAEVKSTIPTENFSEMSIQESEIHPQKSETTPLTSASQIPMTIVIELGQIKMAMEQVIKLEPGNLLELIHKPENGVNLTVNGCLIGRAELIRIGESLGVRILEIGH